jgi:hypothetical protein
MHWKMLDWLRKTPHLFVSSFSNNPTSPPPNHTPNPLPHPRSLQNLYCHDHPPFSAINYYIDVKILSLVIQMINISNTPSWLSGKAYH